MYHDFLNSTKIFILNLKMFVIFLSPKSNKHHILLITYSKLKKKNNECINKWNNKLMFLSFSQISK